MSKQSIGQAGKDILNEKKIVTKEEVKKVEVQKEEKKPEEDWSED